MSLYSNLFTPIKVGGMTVKNRIFMPPVSTHLADEQGKVTDELLAYYSERAKGGVGLITVPSVLIEKLSRYGTYRNLCLYETWHVENMRKLTDCVHAHGTKICAQLLHPSIACPPSYNEGRQPVAASAVEGKTYPDIPRAITIDEIKEYVVKFGNAAYLAKMAGFDGVELHCCHKHGLLGNFLSPLHNKRTDMYGGNVDGRMRFALEVIAEIRNRVGRDYPIIVRMSATDEQPGGQTIMEGMYIAHKFEEAGASMIHLSDGSFDIPYKTTGPVGTPQGFNAEYAKKIKKVINIPLGLVGRINEGWVAEMLLDQEICDAVYMGRALVCDPELPKKIADERENEIRPCIGCLKCLHAANNDLPFVCTMNPEAGHELERSTEKKPEAGERILVVGGGPAGLTASTYAAEKGYEVTIAERTAGLGGQMTLAAVPPCKQEIAKGTAYMISNAERAGVKIELNTEISADFVKKGQYDQVVIANGNEAVKPKFLQGATCLVTARDILSGAVRAGKKVVIVGGGSVGCETADFILRPLNDLNPLSRDVTVIEVADYVCQDEKTSARPLLIERLLNKGCHILTKASVKSVEGDTIIYEKDGEEHVMSGVDMVIAAVGSRTDNTLKESLANCGVSVHTLENTVNIQVATQKAFDFVQSEL